MKLKAETIDTTEVLHITQRFVIQRRNSLQQGQHKGFQLLPAQKTPMRTQ